MTEIFNVYCDESCHLERDGQKAMVLGAVWCPEQKRREISTRLREIKNRHGLAGDFEIKWTKVGERKYQFYQDCIDYFFDDDDLHFRGVIIPDKTLFQHDRFGQDHDDWYYKMHFTMLKTIFKPDCGYRVYIDIKDTLGNEKVDRLHKILCDNAFDYSRKIIQRIQRIHSHEVDLLQLTDLLIGCLSYLHRGLRESRSKMRLIERVQARSHYQLMSTTLPREEKFNLLVWQGAR